MAKYPYDIGWVQDADGEFMANQPGSFSLTPGGEPVQVEDLAGQPIQLTTNSRGRVVRFTADSLTGYVDFGAGPAPVYSTALVDAAAQLPGIQEAMAAMQSDMSAALSEAQRLAALATAAGMSPDQLAALAAQKLQGQVVILGSDGKIPSQYLPPITATDTTDYDAIIAKIEAARIAGGLV